MIDTATVPEHTTGHLILHLLVVCHDGEFDTSVHRTHQDATAVLVSGWGRHVEDYTDAQLATMEQDARSEAFTDAGVDVRIEAITIDPADYLCEPRAGHDPVRQPIPAPDVATEMWHRIRAAIYAARVSRSEVMLHLPTCHLKKCRGHGSDDVDLVFGMFADQIADSVRGEMWCETVTCPDFGPDFTDCEVLQERAVGQADAWIECGHFPRHAWLAAAQSGRTQLGYWDWVWANHDLGRPPVPGRTRKVRPQPCREGKNSRADLAAPVQKAVEHGQLDLLDLDAAVSA